MSTDLPELSEGDNPDESGLDSIDLANFGVETEPEPLEGQPGEESPGSGGGDNPAWADVLSAIPEAFHELLKPKLKDWDRGVNAKFQQIHEEYKPLKAFEDLAKEQVSVEDIKQAYAASKLLETNPLEYYNRLGEYLKTTGALQAEELNSEDDPSEEYDPDDPVQQKLAELERSQAAFIERIQTQEAQEKLAAEQRAMDQRLEAEIKSLEDKHGTMSDTIKEEIFNRAIIKAQRENRYVPLNEAWNDLQQFMMTVRKSRPTPPKLPSGGGVPVPTENMPADSKGVKGVATEFVKAMLDARNNDG